VGGIRIVCFPADDAELRDRIEAVMRGIPSHGNDTRQWDLSQPDNPNPEHRA